MKLEYCVEYNNVCRANHRGCEIGVELWLLDRNLGPIQTALYTKETMLEFDHSPPSLYTKSCTYIKFLWPRQLYEILSYILVVLKDVTDKLSMFSGAYCYLFCGFPASFQRM
jgi:hypothetical protein